MFLHDQQITVIAFKVKREQMIGRLQAMLV